jgi:hypothetical protein
MNPSMWLRAIQVIPRIDRPEWDRLDFVSRWLIASRAAVLVLTFLSAAVAGLLALRDGSFHFWPWVLLTIGLVMAHATNNLINDLIDFRRGVDEDNYFRTQYGPQTVQQGLLSEKQLIAYAAGTGAVAALCGLGLAALRGAPILALMAVGAVFVLFYTWPLKYIGLGELTVLLVWGPLMVGGGYFADPGGFAVRARRDDGHLRQAYRQTGGRPGQGDPYAAGAARGAHLPDRGDGDGRRPVRVGGRTGPGRGVLPADAGRPPGTVVQPPDLADVSAPAAGGAARGGPRILADVVCGRRVLPLPRVRHAVPRRFDPAMHLEVKRDGFLRRRPCAALHPPL